MKNIKFIQHTAALTLCALLSCAFLATPAWGQAPAQGKYKNFRVAMYVLRGNVMKWSDSQALAADSGRLRCRRRHA